MADSNLRNHDPDSDLPDRYMVLSDGETFLPLKGSKIITISDELEGDDVDAAIKARCRDHDDDAEEGEGVTVLYSAHGYEPGLADGQTTMPLTGVVAVVAAAPKPAGEIIGERRTIVLEFLGHKDALSADEMDIADLLHRASSEDLLCDVKATVVEPVDGATLARLAAEARSDAGFFELDKDGCPLDTGEH
jgi:hypothetical protein